MIFKADVDRVSDFDYLEDLGLTTADRSQNSLRSVAFAEKPLDRSLLTGEAAYFQDLTQKSNGATLQYLPSVSYFTEYLSLLNQKMYVDLSTDATNFSDGCGGQVPRFTATPTARVPYSVRRPQFPVFGWYDRQVLLSTSARPRHRRRHTEPRGRHSTGRRNAQFLKNASTDLFNLGQFQSVITPRVQYSYVKNVDSFANVPMIDPDDRTNDANMITYSFNHYLNAVKDGEVREISLIEITQTYGLTGRSQSPALSLLWLRQPPIGRTFPIHSLPGAELLAFVRRRDKHPW